MTPRTLVPASGELLQARAASELSTALEVVTPKSRPKLWRVVPNGDVDTHAKDWAEERGIEYANAN